MKESTINSHEYWDFRFGSGDWENKGGFSQTRYFAEAQVPLLNLPPSFSGSICDFGCGGGDAFPVYQRAFPNAKLIGVDFSEEAIRLCSTKYGSIADFICGDFTSVPDSDVIICSNVIEHLEDDLLILSTLMERCTKLFVIVPYMEDPLRKEHIRSYNLTSFETFSPTRSCVFFARGWSLLGWRLFYDLYFKNIFRIFIGRELLKQKKQILFEFNCKLASSDH